MQVFQASNCVSQPDGRTGAAAFYPGLHRYRAVMHQALLHQHRALQEQGLLLGLRLRRLRQLRRLRLARPARWRRTRVPVWNKLGRLQVRMCRAPHRKRAVAVILHREMDRERLPLIVCRFYVGCFWTLCYMWLREAGTCRVVLWSHRFFIQRGLRTGLQRKVPMQLMRLPC